jgi:protein TonB
MFRLVSSFSAACVISILFLFALKSSIEVSESKLVSSDNLRVIDFVRLQRDEALTEKERIKPKKPEPQKQPIKPKIDIPKPDPPDKVNRKTMQRMKIDLPVNLATDSTLDDALVAVAGGREVNANVIPLARVNPIYPKRARMMKLEGFVKLEFTITPSGGVVDMKVLESEPPNVFDRSAKRALSKWKFKPKIENNTAVEQRASVQINFQLDRKN